MNYECITTRVEGEKVAIITLNRPKALNALNDQLMDELGHALKGFDAEALLVQVEIDEHFSGLHDVSFQELTNKIGSVCLTKHCFTCHHGFTKVISEVFTNNFVVRQPE